MLSRGCLGVTSLEIAVLEPLTACASTAISRELTRHESDKTVGTQAAPARHGPSGVE